MPKIICAIFLIFAISSASSADNCLEVMRDIITAMKSGDPDGTISSVRLRENMCVRELSTADYAWDASMIMSAYEGAGNYKNAVFFATKCIGYRYNEAECHLSRVRSLFYLGDVKSLRKHWQTALRTCQIVNEDSRDRLASTRDQIEIVQLKGDLEVSQMCLDQLPTFRPR